MRLWIAFFRGVNVGGNNILPMKELKRVLEKMGCDAVSTYIQSGNVVFRHREADASKLEAEIRAVVRANFGFELNVLSLTREQLSAACSNNPFPAGEDEPKTLHLFFMADDPVEVDRESLANLQNETEQFELLDRVFYLCAPDGIGRSKLAAKVEKCLGVSVTARNWRTVNKVLQLATDAM
jgi:uncharacterized protein (DUF1697 family)